IERIENASGQVVWQAKPKIACEQCAQQVSLADVPLKGATEEDVLQSADAVRGGAGALPADQIAQRVISPQNDYIMTDMMADVIKRGTGRRAMVLGRSDLAGKTGTSNQAVDTWFNGFTPTLEATV